MLSGTTWKDGMVEIVLVESVMLEAVAVKLVAVYSCG